MLSNDTPVGGLYLIWLSDTHYYGGRARVFKRRWRTHIRELRAGTHANSRMQAVFNKHGRFEPEILVGLAPEEHEDAEQEWLDANFRKPGCVNVSPLARGGCKGHSAETRAKMSETRRTRPDLVEKARETLKRNQKNLDPKRMAARARQMSLGNIGRVQDPEVVARRAESNRGRKNTAETKAKMSESAKRRAKEHPTVHGPETKALISSQQKGRVWVNDGKTNRRVFPEEAESLLAVGWLPGRKPRPEGAPHGNTGRKHTAEARVKMSAAQRGKVRSAEAVARTAAANRGQKRTAESRAKMLESATRWWSENTEARQQLSERQRGRVWVNNGVKNQRLFPEEARALLEQGWVRGRSR